MQWNRVVYICVKEFWTTYYCYVRKKKICDKLATTGRMFGLANILSLFNARGIHKKTIYSSSHSWRQVFSILYHDNAIFCPIFFILTLQWLYEAFFCKLELKEFLRFPAWPHFSHLDEQKRINVVYRRSEDFSRIIALKFWAHFTIATMNLITLLINSHAFYIVVCVNFRSHVEILTNEEHKDGRLF